MKFAYIRVSTSEQNTGRQQLEADKFFTDKLSGKNTERPELQRMLSEMRAGDHILCHDISRLARSLKDLMELIESITGKGCSIEFVKEGLKFSADKCDPMNELMLNLLGAVYQFERDISHQRIMEGVVIAKQEGKYKGRAADVRLHSKIKIRLTDGETIRGIAKALNCSPSTVQRIKNDATSSIIEV